MDEAAIYLCSGKRPTSLLFLLVLATEPGTPLHMGWFLLHRGSRCLGWVVVGLDRCGYARWTWEASCRMQLDGECCGSGGWLVRGSLCRGVSGRVLRCWRVVLDPSVCHEVQYHQRTGPFRSASIMLASKCRNNFPMQVCWTEYAVLCK